MPDKGIYVRMIPLPDKVRDCTIPNDDATFDVYVNSRLPEEWQEKALQHELRHIRMGHFYNSDPVEQNEREAG